MYLKNFSSIQKINIYFFQGYSGSGKSTLLKIITQNINYSSGLIDLNLGDKDKICLVLQEDALFPWLNGIQNITAVLSNIEEQTIFNHEMYPYLKDFIHKKAYSLSYGQRRLIELFRAILYKPNILCLDEPFNYLDKRSRNFVSEIIFSNSLFDETKHIVMTTHYDSDITNLKGVDYSIYYFNGEMPYEKLEKRK